MCIRDRAKTHIQFNIRTSNHSRFDKSEEGAEKLTLDDVYRQVKLKLVKEVAAVLAQKKSMKLKAGVNFEMGKVKIDPFQDKHTEKDKDYIEDKQKHSYGAQILNHARRQILVVKSIANLPT